MIEERYIIDTDPGDDIDDAFAITLAVKAKLDLVGITTVFRNSVQRAKMTKMLLRLLHYHKVLKLHSVCRFAEMD